jgi:hypothetical protein
LAKDLVLATEEGREVLCSQAAKCVGKLVSAARAVPISRILFREINACIYEKKCPDWKGSISLSREAMADLVWIVQCFSDWNGKGSPIWLSSQVVTVDCAVIQDSGPRAVGFSVRELRGVQACDAPAWLPHEQAGRGVLGEELLTSGACVLESSIGTIELTEEEAELQHVHKELLGVVLTFASRREELRNRRVCVMVDSTTSVAYLVKWGGSSLRCNRLVRRLWAICARFNIKIVQASHIAGSVMISAGVDALSRPVKFARGHEADRDDWRMVRTWFEWIQQQWQVCFTVDRMASRANRQCVQFCSHSSVDPEAFGASAFAGDWRFDRWGQPAMNYCFPPFALLPRVMQHLRECGAWAAVVLPNWPSQCWWVDMMSLCEDVLELPKEGVFERVKDGSWQVVGNLSFVPLVCMLNGSKGAQSC